MKLSDGSCKIAYTVSKVGSGPLEVCFGAAPGSRPSKDFKVSAAVLNAALNGKKEVIVEMCLGLSALGRRIHDTSRRGASVGADADWAERRLGWRDHHPDLARRLGTSGGPTT